MVPPQTASTGHTKPKVIHVGTGESRLGHNADALVEGSSSLPGITRHTNDRDIIQRNQTTSANQTHALLCVVCEQRPQYSKQGTTYPTCGLTCARKLASNNGPQGMCCVCGVRPKYSNGSKQYRTCGTECDAKLRNSDTSGRMCDYCHQRPKFHDGRRIYPQCGRECRDNARRAMASRRSAELSKPNTPSKTNSACLLCWNVAMIPSSDLCKNCAAIATQMTGLLLEAPRGHATFNDVAAQFKTAWNSGTQCPDVVEVYKVLEPAVATANFMSYRDKISTDGRFNVPKGRECRRWHGTTRHCGSFDPADTDLCTSESCSLCLTIRNSFDLKKFASGIYTSSTSSQSSAHAYTGNPSRRKTLLLVDIVAGKEIELTPDENPHHGGPDYDAISLVGYTSSGKRIEYDELLVFHKDAVKPLYIVVHD